MLMVVFGAGASYDAIPSFPPGTPSRINYDSQFRMPLADHLFEDRDYFVRVQDEYKEYHPIVPLLRSRIDDKSVEQVLQGLLAEVDKYPQRRCQLAAIRYYLQTMIHNCEHMWWSMGRGVTNHVTLLDQIQRWRQNTNECVCFVTFNYDTLIERALRIIGINFDMPSDYINNNFFKLIKLHGSITWGREVLCNWDIRGQSNTDIAHKVIQNIHGITINQTYDKIDNYPPDPKYDVPRFPAIAIPVEVKNDFECPANHVAKLKEMIPQVDRILIIGWRATEKPFLQLLAADLKLPVKGLVVAGSGHEALTTIANIKRANVKGDFEPSRHAFTNFILTQAIDQFLNK